MPAEDKFKKNKITELNQSIEMNKLNYDKSEILAKTPSSTLNMPDMIDSFNK